jgi:transcriptional regulator with XRE-family HTH domain
MDKTDVIVIGSRLRAFREKRQIPRSGFAVKIGFGSERIASYESGRAPLPYAVFFAISKNYFINPFWLATGDGDDMWHLPLPSARDLNVPDNAVFIEVFSNHLSRLFDIGNADPKSEIVLRYQRTKTAAMLIEQNFVDVPDGMVRDFEYDLDNFVQEWFSKHPEKDPIRKLQRRLWYKTFSQKLEQRIAAETKSGQNQSKERLDKKTGLSDKVCLKKKIRSLPDLMAALREHTKLRGQKATLARELNVSRQAIDQWLSGNAKPSAEITFKLLNRVEQQERQK